MMTVLNDTKNGRLTNAARKQRRAFIRSLKKQGLNYTQIADKMNAAGFKRASDGGPYNAGDVYSLVQNKGKKRRKRRMSVQPTRETTQAEKYHWDLVYDIVVAKGLEEHARRKMIGVALQFGGVL